MSNEEEFGRGCFNPFGCYTVQKPRKKKQNGFCKITYINGSTYIGETKDKFFVRRREGHGKYTFKDGDVYEGEWKEGVKEGYGKYTSKDGDVYEGEWKGGVREGHGKMTYENGDVYEGEWKEDKIKQNRTIKKIPLDNAENIFLQNIEDIKKVQESFTKQNTKKNKSYIDITQCEEVPQGNTNKKDHLKIIYSDHGAKGSRKLKEPICELPNANGRKSYYISIASCHGAFVDPDDNNLIDKIKENIKGTDAVGFFSHARDGYGVCIENTIDKNNQIGLKRLPNNKEGVNVNNEYFNTHKDEFFHYYCILNEGNKQNIYKIPHQLCYWREVLIDDTNTSDKSKYPNKFMEALDCLKQGKSFEFTTRAQVDVVDKLVEKNAKITISGKAEKTDVVIKNNKIPEIKVMQSESQSINNMNSIQSKSQPINNNISIHNNENNNTINNNEKNDDKIDGDLEDIDKKLRSFKHHVNNLKNVANKNINTENIKNNTHTNRGNGKYLPNH